MGILGRVVYSHDAAFTLAHDMKRRNSEPIPERLQFS
jgi:hypothetical protein